MDAPQQPTPPDPVATANAQTASNRSTAITQQGLNQTNQYGPQGSLEYTQQGTWGDGTPHYAATTTLSPEQQNLYNQQSQLGSNVNQLALDQTGRLSTLLGQPVNLSNDATEGRLFELGRQRLDPMLSQQWQGQENELMNRGIMPGTEAYDRSRTAFDQRQNDAYNQLLLSGRGQSVSEALAERNQPINEITALMSGGQVHQPTFTNTPQSNVAPTDYAGIQQSNFANQFANYNAQMQQNNAMLGGLFGLGGAVMGAGGRALGGWGGRV